VVYKRVWASPAPRGACSPPRCTGRGPSPRSNHLPPRGRSTNGAARAAFQAFKSPESPARASRRVARRAAGGGRRAAGGGRRAAGGGRRAAGGGRRAAGGGRRAAGGGRRAAGGQGQGQGARRRRGAAKESQATCRGLHSGGPAPRPAVQAAAAPRPAAGPRHPPEGARGRLRVSPWVARGLGRKPSRAEPAPVAARTRGAGSGEAGGHARGPRLAAHMVPTEPAEAVAGFAVHRNGRKGRGAQGQQNPGRKAVRQAGRWTGATRLRALAAAGRPSHAEGRCPRGGALAHGVGVRGASLQTGGLVKSAVPGAGAV
jgi:hypothetical protein